MTQKLQFLINCCKSKPTRADIEQISAKISRFDITELADITALAHTHGVLPLVFHAVQTHAAGHISEKSIAPLKKSYIITVAKNSRMTAEMIRLIRLLNENDIQALAFKGPSLSQLAYGDITSREFHDLDILIKRQDARRVAVLLTEDKYISEFSLAEDIADAYVGWVNVIGFRKLERIEIHWDLLSINYAIHWPENSLWGNTDTTTIDGISIPIPAYNTHLLYLCAHGAKHLFERLEWVCDIDRMIRVTPDLNWQSLFEEAKERRIERILRLGLYLSHKLLSLPLPENIKTEVMNDAAVKDLGQRLIDMNFNTSDGQGRSYRSFFLLWRMRENRSDRIRFAYRAMFAPKFDDFIFIKLPRHLLFLYPIIRPFRLLAKYFMS